MVTESTALIIRAMLDAPKASHNTTDLAETTGIPRPTVAHILRRLDGAGWAYSWLGRRTRYAPPRWYQLTAAGIKAGRAELECWAFSDAAT